MKVRAHRKGERSKRDHFAELYSAEALESRLLLSTISWAAAVSGDWDTASNWSSGTVPGAGDDVVISVPGTYTITHTSAAADYCLSLNCSVTTATIAISNGSLEQDGTAATPSPTSQVNGVLDITGGATLTVTGGTFTASGTVTLNDANLVASLGSQSTSGGQISLPGVSTFSSTNLTASGGGQILFPDATGYTNNISQNSDLSAGAGSRIDLSSLSYLDNDYDWPIDITPSDGGEIDLGGGIGAWSVLKLSDTASTLDVANVTDLANVTVTISCAQTLNFTALQSLTNTNLYASGGGQIYFPDGNATDSGGTVQASGVGSRIGLPSVSQGGIAITPSNGGEIDLGSTVNDAYITLSDATATLGVSNVTQINSSELVVTCAQTLNFTSLTSMSGTVLFATAAGQILCPSLTSYTAQQTEIEASGAGSRIDLSSLSSFNAGGGASYNADTITPSDGGEIDLGGFINGPVDITISDSTSILGVANVTRLSDVTLTLSGTQTLNFAGVVRLSNTNLTANAGGQILFPAAQEYFYGTVQTSDGSLISLPALAEFGGPDDLVTVDASTNGRFYATGELTFRSESFTATTGGQISVGGQGGTLTMVNVSGSGSLFQLNPGSQVYAIPSYSTLSITNGGTLDITNNEVLIAYAYYGYGSDPRAAILSDLASGSNGGAWNGTGIISSTAAASDMQYGVGFTAPPFTYYTSGEIEVAYALYGDITMQGLVNANDFSILSSNFGQVVTNGWEAGDFLYDGVVSAEDFHLLAGNFGQTAVAVAAAPASAPIDEAISSSEVAAGISSINAVPVAPEQHDLASAQVSIKKSTRAAAVNLESSTLTAPQAVSNPTDQNLHVDSKFLAKQ